MKLTSEQVKKVAKLANLPLTEEEEEKYSEQLSKILEYAEQLNQVDTLVARPGHVPVEPTFNVTGLSSVMREDEPQVCLSQEEALSGAPRKKGSMFETKEVFED